jgi:DAK2 domain fusion protein YloV
MSIEKALEIVVEEAKASLSRTPDLLPILKEVGVVDSGGTGLVRILEGMLSALKGVIVPRYEGVINDGTPHDHPSFAGSEIGNGEEFGYCTEFILRLGPAETKKVFHEKRFVSVLSTYGNSLVEVRDDDIVKVHIHTLSPGKIFTYAQNFGEFLAVKAENMTEQHNALENGAEAPNHSIKLAVDEHTKKVEAVQEVNEFALIAVCTGDGLNDYFKLLGVSEIVSGGQSMNPSCEDFIEAIKRSHAKNVFLLPNNPNIILAAEQAAEVIKDECHVMVIPTKTIPEGIAATMMFNPGLSVDENYNDMCSSLENVKSGAVTFAIKDSNIEGVSIQKGDFMGIVDKKIVTCVKERVDAVKTLVDSMIDMLTSVVTVLVGDDVGEDEIQDVQAYLKAKYADVDFAFIEGKQPTYSFLVGVE